MQRSLLAAFTVALIVLGCSLLGDKDQLSSNDSPPSPNSNAEGALTGQGEGAPTVVEEALPVPLWVDEEILVGKGDFIGTMLQAQGLSYSQSLALVAAAKEIHNLEKIRRGDVFTFRRLQADGSFLGLSYPLDRHNEKRLVVVREGKEGFTASLDQKTFKTTLVGRAGHINGSLWQTVTEMNLGWGTAANMAAIFEWELDFNTQVREGDSFRVLLEEHSDPATGKVVRYGTIHAAEYVNSGTSFVGLRYEDKEGEVGFFNAEGMSSKKMFLKSPLKFSRVSSGFGRRFHPILKRWRNHNGTDYSAPHGTPIRSIGRGTISFSGTKGGYGKHVRVKHNGKHSSSYSHLSRIAVRRGSTVRQGDIVGYVGATGLATGPHLHFEFYVNGKYADYRRQRFARTEPIAANERANFKKLRDAILPKMRALSTSALETQRVADRDSEDTDADSHGL